MQNISVGYSYSTTYKEQGAKWLCLWYLRTFMENSPMSWGWLVAPNVAGQSGERKGWAGELEFAAQVPRNDLKASLYARQGTLISSSHQTEIAEKSNPQAHPATGWIRAQGELPDSQGVSLLKWGHWLWQNGILSWGHAGRSQWNWGTLSR